MQVRGQSGLFKILRSVRAKLTGERGPCLSGESPPTPVNVLCQALRLAQQAGGRHLLPGPRRTSL